MIDKNIYITNSARNREQKEEKKINEKDWSCLNKQVQFSSFLNEESRYETKP